MRTHTLNTTVHLWVRWRYCRNGNCHTGETCLAFGLCASSHCRHETLADLQCHLRAVFQTHSPRVVAFCRPNRMLASSATGLALFRAERQGHLVTDLCCPAKERERERERADSHIPIYSLNFSSLDRVSRGRRTHRSPCAVPSERMCGKRDATLRTTPAMCLRCCPFLSTNTTSCAVVTNRGRKL